VVLASTYTLAGVKPFPAAVEDAHAVLLWAKKNKAKLGWTGKQLLVAGIEAGANLAAVCALMSRDRGGPALAGQILIMPMLDPGLSTCSMRDMQPGRSCWKWPTLAPQPTAATCRMPPTAPPVCIAAAIEPSEKPAAGADPVHRRRPAARRSGTIRRQIESCGVTTTVPACNQPPERNRGATNVLADATRWEKSPASSLVWNGLRPRPHRTPVPKVVTETSPLACRRGASTVFSRFS
jgi:acetyl esterase/lipase